jgi:hypothetical protein
MLKQKKSCPDRKDELIFLIRKQGLSVFYESDKYLLAQYCKIIGDPSQNAWTFCGLKRMPSRHSEFPNGPLKPNHIFGLAYKLFSEYFCFPEL